MVLGPLANALVQRVSGDKGLSQRAVVNTQGLDDASIARPPRAFHGTSKEKFLIQNRLLTRLRMLLSMTVRRRGRRPPPACKPPPVKDGNGIYILNGEKGSRHRDVADIAAGGSKTIERRRATSSNSTHVRTAEPRLKTKRQNIKTWAIEAPRRLIHGGPSRKSKIKDHTRFPPTTLGAKATASSQWGLSPSSLTAGFATHAQRWKRPQRRSTGVAHVTKRFDRRGAASSRPPGGAHSCSRMRQHFTSGGQAAAHEPTRRKNMDPCQRITRSPECSCACVAQGDRTAYPAAGALGFSQDLPLAKMGTPLSSHACWSTAPTKSK